MPIFNDVWNKKQAKLKCFLPRYAKKYNMNKTITYEKPIAPNYQKPSMNEYKVIPDAIHA